MVHSSDNETALYQEPEYLQVREIDGVCILPLTMNLGFFFGSGWKLFTVSGEGAR